MKRARVPLALNSHLGTLLIEEWAWGHKSAVEVQVAAAASLKDHEAVLLGLGLDVGFAPSDIRKLSEIGTKGKHTSNCKRDLLNLLQDPDLPEAYQVSVPMKISKVDAEQEVVQERSFPILLPHETFAKLYQDDKPLFSKLLMDGGDDCTVKDFWAEVRRRKDPRLEEHPMLERTDWDSLAIPLSLHGDAVPCTSVGKSGSKSYDVCSMQGLLSSGPTLEMKMYIYGIFEVNNSTSDESDTQFHIWRVVVWSLWWAFQGRWPTHDPRGKEYPRGTTEGDRGGHYFAGGRFFVLWLLKADLDHLAKGFGLAHYGANHPCPLCPADRTPGASLAFNNFKTTAQWMKSAYTPSHWRRANPNPHYVFQLGYLSCWNVEPDELHIMHLGTSMYMAGSVLWVLCHQILPESPAKNMAIVWQELVTSYKSNKVPTQYSSLTLKSFEIEDSHDKKYPKLKGKGAEVKDLMESLLEVWQKHMNKRNSDHKLVLGVLEKQCKIQAILSEHKASIFLPTNEAKKVAQLVSVLLQEYSILSSRSEKKGELLWNVVPKHHWLHHLGTRAYFIHPRRGCTFIDEDFVGRAKDVVQASVHGTEPSSLPDKFVEKYRWGMTMLRRARSRE